MKKTYYYIAVLSAFPCVSLNAASLSLESTMDENSVIRDYDFSGSFAQINKGTNSGVDADAYWNINNPSQKFGAGINEVNDMYPNEGDFGVGSLDFNASLVTTTGVATFPIQGVVLDLSNDLRAVSLKGFFFGSADSVDFSLGGFDANDTVTFTDQLLTSIDIDTSFTMTVTAGPNVLPYSGTFAVSGSALTIDMDQTNPTPGFTLSGSSRFVFDFDGVVDGVGVTTVPEPSGVLFLIGGLIAGSFKRRR
jgi:hypothetical protein